MRMFILVVDIDKYQLIVEQVFASTALLYNCTSLSNILL